MDQSENEFKLMRNFATLKTHLKIDCAIILGHVLEQLYQDIKSLKESKTFQLLDQKCQEEILKKNGFVLSIPVLCEVFEKMDLDEYSAESIHLPPTFRIHPFIGNVLLLKNIWEKHIADNNDEKISSEKMQQLSEDLKHIGEEMASQFPGIGDKYAKSVQQLQTFVIEKEVSSSQIGNGNTVSVNFGKNTDTLLFLEQFGNSNKVIIQIEDRRQSKLLELQSSGTVKLRMVLRSNDTPEWREITEGMMTIDLSDFNSDPVLKEAGITVDTIERGCVVVSLTTAYGIPIRTSLTKLFAVLFRVLKIELTLQKCNVSELEISGYVYCSEMFYEGQDSDKCQQLSIIRHLSWKNLTTICDIDIYVTNLMKTLIQNGFSADGKVATNNMSTCCIEKSKINNAFVVLLLSHYTAVDEQLELQIRWDIAENMVKDLTSCQLPATFDANLSEELKTLDLSLMNKSEKAVFLRFKCTDKFGYQKLVQEGGTIYTITKMLFKNVLVSRVQLSILLDTNYVHDSDNGHGVVLHLSKFSGAVTTGFVSKIITTMLEEEDSPLSDGENIKVKAILEYEEATEKDASLPLKQIQIGRRTQYIKTKRDSSDESVEHVSSINLKYLSRSGTV